jgi:hypothetical protein
MPVFSGSLSQVTLAELLQTIVTTKKTGFLKIKEGGQEGFLAMERGLIAHAETGPYTALDALFQFVIWRDAHFDFHEEPLPTDLDRDLEVYDPTVLIAGLAAKAHAAHPL